MSTPSKSQNIKAIPLLTDDTLLNFFGGEEPACFHCLLWCFASGSKWYMMCLILGYNYLRKIGLFSFWSDVSIRGTHLADSLLIPKISVKAVWTDPTLMPRASVMCLTVTAQHLFSVYVNSCKYRNNRFYFILYKLYYNCLWIYDWKLEMFRTN